MVIEYSNYTEEFRILNYSEMDKHSSVWSRNTNIHETIENLGFGVQKRIRSWGEDKVVIALALMREFKVNKRKVTDTEYLVDNNVVTEQRARNTVRERQRELERQRVLEEQNELEEQIVLEEQFELEEQLKKTRERDAEEQQRIIEIGDQIETLISRGALEMYNEMDNYEEKEYKNHLFETHKKLEYALEFNLEPKKINFLLLRNSLLNQGLFCYIINDLTDNKNSDQNNKIIVFLDYVIDFVENAIALLNGLENIPTGHLHETLDDLKKDAVEQRQECRELIQSNQVSLNEITTEQRIKNLQKIEYQASVTIRQLNEIVQNQELSYRHLDG